MGQAASAIIDDLHTSAQMPDEIAAERKVSCLVQVQDLGRDASVAVQIIEQGGIQPLLRCYNATHPLVRVEAAKALAVLAQQPENQVEMGVDEILPRYHPALLTASHDFCEHAMALLAALATQEVNRMKIAHEGLLGPIIQAMTAPHERLQLNALDALAKLCEASQIAVLATQRGVLPPLLRAARSTDPAIKLAVIRVLTGIGRCGENLSAFIASGAAIFLMGCTYCGADVQLAVAQCLEGLLEQVYEGSAELHEKDAAMLATMTQLEVSPERISEVDPMDFDAHAAMEMPLVELVPEFVARIKRLINCDRASVFIRERGDERDDLTTVLADGLEQITIPVDMHSIAGECAVQGSLINLRKAYERENFNRDVDRKTGYTTRSMLVVPIRRRVQKAGASADDDDDESADAAQQQEAASSEPPIGVVQCINKLGAPVGDNVDDEGVPTFSPEDERKLDALCRALAPVLDKVAYKKRAPRKANQLTSDWVSNIGTLAALDIDTVLRVSLERVRDLVLADRASLFVHDRKKKQLWTRLAQGMEEVRLPANSGIVGAVCTSGEPLNIADAYKDARFNRRIDTASGYRTRTVLCVPLKNQRGDVVAVVQVINKTTGTLFTVEDEANLGEFCWQIASVLEFKTAAGGAAAAAGGGASASVATGDAISLLLHLLQLDGEPKIQLHAACCIGHLSRNEANRERVAALGGVPTVLSLGMPWPWREKGLLRGISRSVGFLTASAVVRHEIAAQGGWKSILALAQTSDEEVWFDSLRALANLALHEPPSGSHAPPLSRAMLDAGALEIVMSFLSRPKATAAIDLRVQAVRLAANLSSCCHDGADAGATRQFSRGDVVRRLGEAASEAAAAARDTLSSQVGAGETLADFAAAYARLSRVPAIALWLFDVVGVGILEAFAAATGPIADDVRAHLGEILANCLRIRQNQRIVLHMLRSNDPTEATFRAKPTAEQRMLMLRERDALRTGKEVRGIMTRLLRAPSANPSVYVGYARLLQMLAAEPSNHTYMMQRHDVSSYLEQLVLLASPSMAHDDARAAALCGLRLLAEACHVDGILRILTGQMRIVPALMHAVQRGHDATSVEVCRLVRALAKQPEIAEDMIRSQHPVILTGAELQRAMLRQQAQPPPTAGQPPQQAQQAQQAQPQSAGESHNVAAGRDGSPSGPTTKPFLALLSGLLASHSPEVLMEACLALEPLARDHRVEMCQAKVVGLLIALVSHRSSAAKDAALVEAAGRVLRMLAQDP